MASTSPAVFVTAGGIKVLAMATTLVKLTARAALKAATHFIC
jgi:hypothetical protein